jgi:hypothetical protein
VLFILGTSLLVGLEAFHKSPVQDNQSLEQNTPHPVRTRRVLDSISSDQEELDIQSSLH